MSQSTTLTSGDPFPRNSTKQSRSGKAHKLLKRLVQWQQHPVVVQEIPEVTAQTIAAASMQYEYLPLPTPSSFRYLELHPGSGKDKVSVRLHLADWDNPPAYEAISYTWGNPKDKSPLFLEGRSVEIPENLLHGLRHMRSATLSRYVWADSICINQACVKERNQQVRNMRRIYENAKRVIVWLGQDAVGSAAAAFEALEEVAGTCTTDVPLRDVANLYNLVPDTCCSRLQKYVRDRAAELAEMLRFPWFERLWVLQEVNATKEIMVQWGSNLVSWDVLAVAINFFLHHDSQFPMLMSSKSGSMANIDYMRARQWLAGEHILSALHFGRGFRCSDSRDHIYALLGMPAIHNKFDIAVDYSKTALELFEHVAHLVLPCSKTLSMLSYVQHTLNDLESSPSWIPKWDEELHLRPLIQYEHDFNADCGALLQLQLNKEDHQLVLHGVCFDTIAERKPFHLGESGSGNDCTDLQVFMQRLLNDPHSLFRLNNLGDAKEIMSDKAFLNVCKVLCGGMIGIHRMQDSEDTPASLISFMDCFVQNLRHLPTDQASLMSYPDEAYRYAQATTTNMRGRRLFITTQGYVGCGRSILQPGDKLCVLFGGQIPYILRPVEDHHKFIGEAYVPEFMHGRAIDMLHAGELQEETFILG